MQLEILQSILQSRFGLAVSFSEGGILYKETLTAAVEGIGHYEPLRHYAEVHLLLEPAPRGSGVQLAADCPARHAGRKLAAAGADPPGRAHPPRCAHRRAADRCEDHAGGRRAHQKHTEGGDFRQATYRAVRRACGRRLPVGPCSCWNPGTTLRWNCPPALWAAPWPTSSGCAAPLTRPETLGDTARLRGRLPVATARGYAREVAAYTHGLGRWNVLPAGYDACHDAESVIAASGYDPAADVENPADSVFCSHGAGYTVPWDEVPARAHVDSGLTRRLSPAGQPPEEDAGARRRRPKPTAARWNRTRNCWRSLSAPTARYAAGARTAPTPKRRPAPPCTPSPPVRRPAPAHGAGLPAGDGYNVIFAWDELRRLAEGSLDAARRRLMDILCNYAGYRRCVPILVFDAYKVRGGAREVERYHNLYVVYTREAETADMYIERATHELAKERRTRVVSSDGAEQVIVLGHGALRVSARAFAEEVAAVEKEIREFLQQD